MPHYVVDKVADALNSRRKSINGSTVLIAGIAYKRDIDDMRESPALDVMSLLHEKGARVTYADPWVPHLAGSEWRGACDLEAVELTSETLRAADCVVITTDHKAFDYPRIVREADVIVDTRNAITGDYPNVFKLGSAKRAHEQLRFVGDGVD